VDPDSMIAYVVTREGSFDGGDDPQSEDEEPAF
jgi:hypothetical protein